MAIIRWREGNLTGLKRMMKAIPAAVALLLLMMPSQTFAQSAPVKFLSVASTNSTLVVKTVANRSKLTLKSAVLVNTTAAIYYLKLYDKATAPTCGTDVPKWTVPIPFGASSSGNGFSIPLGDGLEFLLGLGFCITSGVADNDTGNAAAGVVINFGVSTR